MGMFDSYHVPWGDDVTEIQTKQYESLMNTWSLGEINGSLVNDFSDLNVLIEDFYADDQFYKDDNLKYFIALHKNKVFSDFIFADNQEEAKNAEIFMRKNWNNSNFVSLAQSKLMDLLRHNAEYESLRYYQLYELMDGFKDYQKTVDSKKSNKKAHPLLKFFKNKYDFSKQTVIDFFEVMIKKKKDFAQLLTPEKLIRNDHEIISQNLETIESLRSETLSFRNALIYANEKSQNLILNPSWKNPDEALNEIIKSFRFDKLELLLKKYPQLLTVQSNVEKVEQLILDCYYSRILAPDMADFLANTNFKLEFKNSFNQEPPLNWIMSKLVLSKNKITTLFDNPNYYNKNVLKYFLYSSYIDILPEFLEKSKIKISLNAGKNNDIDLLFEAFQMNGDSINKIIALIKQQEVGDKIDLDPYLSLMENKIKEIKRVPDYLKLNFILILREVNELDSSTRSRIENLKEFDESLALIDKKSLKLSIQKSGIIKKRNIL